MDASHSLADQIVPDTLAPGQVHRGTVYGECPVGWLVRLDCDVDVQVHERNRHTSSVHLGSAVHVKIVGLTRRTGQVNGSFVSGPSVSA